MPKYLVTASYTAAGAKGVLSEGGTARQKVVERLVKSAGGKVECMYWAFGPHDFYLIADMPDAAAVGGPQPDRQLERRGDLVDDGPAHGRRPRRGRQGGRPVPRSGGEEQVTAGRS